MPFSTNFVLRAPFAFLMAALILTASAHAQSSDTSTASTKAATVDPDDEGWHVDVAPYLWFPGINGTVGASGHQSSVHVSAGDVLSNFDFGIMGLTEVRYNRIIVPVDFMWVKLSDNKGLPFDPLVQSVNVKINEDILTPKIGYRLASKERFKLDALIGVRYWHLGTTLTLKPVQLGFYAPTNWIDAVQGARIRVMLAPKVELTIAGDAGAGGSRLDYQVVGLLGYKLKRVSLQGGWRYLVIHQSPTTRSFVDLGMTGLVLGAVIPLK
jgi:hypothetical protein